MDRRVIGVDLSGALRDLIFEGMGGGFAWILASA